MAAEEKNEGEQKDATLLSRPEVSLREDLYVRLAIDGFRGLRGFELEDLSRINIFLGRNNSGKTTILEAVYTHACGQNVGPFLSQVISRRQEGTSTGYLHFGEQLRALFRTTSTTPYRFALSARLADRDVDSPLEVTFEPSSELAGLDPLVLGQQHTLSPKPALPTNAVEPVAGPMNFHTVPQLPTVYLGTWTTRNEQGTSSWNVQFPPLGMPATPPFKLALMHDVLSHRGAAAETKVLGYLKRYNLLEEFVENLARDFPEIVSIDMIPYPDGSQGPVYAMTKDNRRLPLWAFGDGLRRWYYLLGHMLVYKNACHCVEEVDATLHPGAYEQFSSLLLKYAQKFNNQLFVTSHNIEFADAFLSALYGDHGVIGSDDEDPVRVFSLRLENDSTTPVVWALRGRDAFARRKDFELELR